MRLVGFQGVKLPSPLPGRGAKCGNLRLKKMLAMSEKNRYSKLGACDWRIVDEPQGARG